MALTKISTGGVKDDTIPEVKFDISNTPTNGYFLKYKDSTDKLTWAAAGDATLAADQTFSGVTSFSGNTNLHGGVTSFANASSSTAITWTKADNELRFEDDVKISIGSGDDLELYHDGSNSIINDNGTGALQLKLGGATKLEVQSTGIAVTGSVSDDKGNLRSIIPNSQGSAYTLVAADAGKFILASGTITVPNGVFSGGDAVTIVNNTGSDLTITKTITTMYNAADGTSDNRTLATRGVATILFSTNTVAYISGAGLS